MLIFGIKFIIGLLALYVGAESLIKGGVAIAKRLGIPTVVIGLTVVGYGTSFPEVIVSLEAARQNQGDIALGNVIGSNICNIGLIASLSLIIQPAMIAPRLIKTDIPIMVAVTTAFYSILMFSNQTMSRLIGITFCVALVVYSIWLVMTAKQDKILESEFKEEIPTAPSSLLLSICLILGGFFLLGIGGNLLLDGAVGFSRLFNVNEAIIGLSLVAISTSLPELATSILAAIRKHGDIAIGNIVGSNIYNILGVAGISSAGFPFQFEHINWLDATMMLGITFLFACLAWWRSSLTKRHGLFLLSIYVLYLFYLIKEGI